MNKTNKINNKMDKFVLYLGSNYSFNSIQSDCIFSHICNLNETFYEEGNFHVKFLCGRIINIWELVNFNGFKYQICEHCVQIAATNNILNKIYKGTIIYEIIINNLNSRVVNKTEEVKTEEVKTKQIGVYENKPVIYVQENKEHKFIHNVISHNGKIYVHSSYINKLLKNAEELENFSLGESYFSY